MSTPRWSAGWRPARVGELQRGYTVLWDSPSCRDVEAEVTRSAKDGTWAEVRYPITASIFPDVTHLTRRVSVRYLWVKQRESDQLDCEQRDADGGREVQEGATRGRVDEADELAPGEAVAHDGGGALPFGGPDPPQERFHAAAVFVGGPPLDGRLGEGVGHRRHERTQVFCSQLAAPCRPGRAGAAAPAASA